MKKIIFCFLFLFCNINSVIALNLDLNSQNIILYNLNNKSIVYEQNKDQKTSIASLTKIMTVLVAIENTNDYNDKYIINSSSFADLEKKGAYTLGLKNNQEVTINDLLYGTLLASGADAARSLALYVSGTENNFIDLMNKKAQELNLKNTHFNGTVGLDDPQNYSTVEDVAIILMTALNNDKFYEIFTTDKYIFSDNTLVVNSSMRKTADAYHLDNNYILGGKTGFTQNAGRCLASIAIDKNNNIKYLLVTTNAARTPNHISDAINLYQYVFNNYKNQTLIAKNDPILTLKTQYSNTKEVSFKSPKNIIKYLPNNYAKNDIDLDYKGIQVITPKILKGQKLGVITISYQKEEITKIPIILNKQIKFSIVGFLYYYKFPIIIIGCLLIVVIIILKKRKIIKY